MASGAARPFAFAREHVPHGFDRRPRSRNCLHKERLRRESLLCLRSDACVWRVRARSRTSHLEKRPYLLRALARLCVEVKGDQAGDALTNHTRRTNGNFCSRTTSSCT
jgi:hypothetical protein